MTGTRHSNVDSDRPAVVCLRVAGDLDSATSPGLRGRLVRAIEDLPDVLVVDLSGVTFMSCAGLRPLEEARAELGERLRLRGPSRPVTRLLQLLGRSSAFTISAAQDAAPYPAPGARSTDAAAGEVGYPLPAACTTDYWRRSRGGPIGSACVRGGGDDFLR